MSLEEIKKLVDSIQVVQSGASLSRLSSPEDFFKARALLALQIEQNRSKELLRLISEIEPTANPLNLHRTKGVVDAMIGFGYK